MGSNGRIKVLVVEREGLLRDLLTRTLAGEASLEVVGAASDSETALRLARELVPDVVLAHVSQPGDTEAIELGQQVKQERPQTGILILASSRSKRLPTSIPRLEGSAWCYLLEESVPSLAVLVRAIESSAMGLVVIDPKLLASRQSQEGSRVGRLSSRYRAVLELMAQGYNNHAIARMLAPLGKKSIENYVNHIYQELGISRGGPWHPRVKAVLDFLEVGQVAGPAA